MKSFAISTSLMPHQVDAVNKVLPSRIGALFMEQGTGKSLTAIELAQLRAGKIDRVVWFCPVSLKRTVRGEILKHTDCTDADICVFDDKITANTIPDAMWYVVGIESMSASTRVVLTVQQLINDRTMVILDESTYIKGHHAIRTRRITLFSQDARYRLAMTGTPLTQGVVDLFAQMRFLSPKILGYNSFYSFAANHLEYSDKFPGMIVRAHNTEYLAAKIKPYVYQVTKAECLNLPQKLYDTKYFDLTDEQRYEYERVKDVFLSLADAETFTNYAIFQLFTYLQQITSGFLNYGGRKEYRHRRLDTLMDAVEGVADSEKVIIWAKYRRDIESVSQALKTAYGDDSVSMFYGNLSEKQRNAEVEKFRGRARFFVATQSTGGHGLTLNESNRVIFYNNGFKYSEREQAEDRCHRIGQQYNVTYTDVHCSHTIDDRIWKALCNKGSVVADFRREIERVKKNRMKELIKAL